MENHQTWPVKSTRFQCQLFLTTLSPTIDSGKSAEITAMYLLNYFNEILVLTAFTYPIFTHSNAGHRQQYGLTLYRKVFNCFLKLLNRKYDLRNWAINYIDIVAAQNSVSYVFLNSERFFEWN